MDHDTPRIEDTDTEPAPLGICLAAGAAAAVAASMLVALVPSTDTVTRLVLMAAVVGGFTAVVENWRAGPPVVVIGYLLFTGFLVNRYGVLTWDTASRWHVAAFAVAAALGLGLRHLRHLHAEAVVDAELRQLTGTTDPATIAK